MDNITVDVSQVQAYLVQLGARYEKIARMAGSSAMRAMAAEANRQIRARKAIQLKYVKKAMTTVFPSAQPGAPLIWELRGTSLPMPVIAYNAKQTAKGVSFEVNKGKRSFIKHAFFATMKSGYVGVFYRTGKGRLPIQQAFSSRVSWVFADIREPVAKKGGEVFLSTFLRLSKIT